MNKLKESLKYSIGQASCLSEFEWISFLKINHGKQKILYIQEAVQPRTEQEMPELPGEMKIQLGSLVSLLKGPQSVFYIQPPKVRFCFL